jgi:competence protein ComEC
MRGKIRRKNAGRFVIRAVLLIAALILSAVELPRYFGGDEGFVFYAFDVGQGDSYLFRFPGGECMLVDAGTGKSGPHVVSRLKALGVRRIDVLAATHPHEDHIGGMADVIGAFEIGRFWDSGYNHGSEVQRSMLRELKRRGIVFERPKAGRTESFGDVRVEVIAPPERTGGQTGSANDNSLVMRVTYKDVSFLMTGDMERQERAGIKRFPRADVLKLAHHGSSNGTDDRMIREISPDIVIMSYGRGNPYGHPHREVTNLIAKYGLKSYATADGEIRIATDGRTVAAEQ